MTPYDYTLNYIVIKANRGSAEPVAYDISRIFAELNIYESLEVPFITGNLTLADSASLSSIVNFNGTEKLEISLQVGQNTLVKEFFITGMRNYSKGAENDGVAAYTLDFVESKAFLSNFKRLRSAYAGNISEIIRKIYQSFLNEDIPDIEEAIQTVQVIIPNLTSIEACIWLMKRATSAYGEPMYLYTSLMEGNHLKSLGTMMSSESIGSFNYSAAMNTRVSLEVQKRNINAYHVPYPDDITRVAKLGGIRTQYLSIDPLTKRISDMSFDVTKHHDNKLSAQRLGRNQHLLFDKSFLVDEKNTIMDRESAFVTSVNTTGMFDKNPSYASEDNPIRHMLKMSRNSDLLMMEKQGITIGCAGQIFLEQPKKNMSIGRKITIQIPKDQPATKETDLNKLIDKKRSGDYIITHAKHSFNVLKKYSVGLALARATGQDPMNDTEEGPS